MDPHKPSPAVFGRHDHSSCIATALVAAEGACRAHGLHLTAVRRRVLEILLETHVALGAYDLLARLRAEGFAAQPPVAYRALGFLIAAGLVHRIEGLNAYVACARPGTGHDPAFMICRTCRTVAEGEAPAPLTPGAEAQGFRIERAVVEAMGLCPACAGAAA
ncbi:MAG: transcriptional repressor [Rubellimicrobium sp.]|nr:transcriptional repressor [Rubellimicrobium sp.]